LSRADAAAAAEKYGADAKTAAAKESDASSNVSDVKMETGSSLSYRPYEIDYGGPTVPADCAADADDAAGAGHSRGRGIPLAGPVPVGPCYATASYPPVNDYYAAGHDCSDHVSAASTRPVSAFGTTLTFAEHT